MNYAVMTDKILKEFKQNIIRSKIRNDRKRAEINSIHQNLLNPCSQGHYYGLDRVDKLVQNGTLFNKPNRD